MTRGVRLKTAAGYVHLLYAPGMSTASALDGMHGEVGEDDVLEVGIIVLVEAFVVEAEEGAQRFLGELEGVKRQRVRRLAEPSGDDGVRAGPVGSLEVQRGAGVLDDPGIRGRAESA